MSENSSIQWTDHTFNPWRGCTKISPGCANCYAARDALRFPNIRGVWGDSGTRILAVPDAWKAPEKWNRAAAAAGTRAKVFCCSLADVFEDWKGEMRFPASIAPDGWVTARWNGDQLVREFEASADVQGLEIATMDHAREELFRLIENTPHLDWLLLTKRPENVLKMVPEHWREAFPDNVWIGTTVENQEMADKRIPELLKIPAKVRFLSCEPMVSHVDLCKAFGIWWNQTAQCWFRGDRPSQCAGVDGVVDWERTCAQNTSGIHWVICGGESGPKARPLALEWARSLRDQCRAAGVAFFMKQLGGVRDARGELSVIPEDLRIREFPKVEVATA